MSSNNYNKIFVADKPCQILPPPHNSVGLIGWLRTHMFRSTTDTLLSLVVLYLLYQLITYSIEWAWLEAVFSAESREECRSISSGACWAFISVRFEQFIYGFYPESLRWRVHLTGIMLIIALLPLFFEKIPGKKFLFGFGFIFPIIAYWLLAGGIFGLEEVNSKKFGGIMLTFLIGITGITFSLPIGIFLALARRSDMIFISVMAVAFVEFIRGVPLITLLFIASTMLNYFFPPGTNFDLLVRVLIMITLFASGYIAETIRGGLQSLSKGQQEAADALGLGYWQSTYLVILPQALKVSIPGIVNIFIGLFKDTTLVLIIGMLDPLGIGRAALADNKWNGLSNEVYIFISIFFFVCCFTMSRYSMYLERRLHTGY